MGSGSTTKTLVIHFPLVDVAISLSFPLIPFLPDNRTLISPQFGPSCRRAPADLQPPLMWVTRSASDKFFGSQNEPLVTRGASNPHYRYQPSPIPHVRPESRS